MPKKVLMCQPTFFDIEYEINPWMHTDNQASQELAMQQWQKLHDIYVNQLGWDVQLIEPVQGLPDMVFTANGGMVLDGKVVLPHFRQPDRQGETQKFKDWFTSYGLTNFHMPKYDFEGEGDAFAWNEYLLIGYPWRTDKPAHAEVANFFGLKPVSLQLADARFYHLDTAMTIINQDTIAIYPKAFTAETLASLHQLVPNLIEANDEDAIGYGLNAMSDGHNIVLSDRAPNLIQIYKNKGFNPIPTPISEFQKSGGGVKCLTLELR